MVNKIVVVGGIPKPIGGVTNFIYRLVHSAPEKFSCVVDLYPSEKKESIPVEHQQFNGPFDGLVKSCAWSSNKRFLFNFSSTRSLLLLALIPKRNNRWGLILHNGLLGQDWISRVMTPVFRYTLKKMDVIGVLSDLQQSFYLKTAVPQQKLTEITSYIPRQAPSADEIEDHVPDQIKRWKATGKRIFIISGYPTKIYQHLETISIFEELWKSGEVDIRLAAFLYGQDTDGLLPEIRQRLLAQEYCAFFWDTPEVAFSSSLVVADGYIRMNTVDSFGIAIADAINFGVLTIASDVCSRYQGTIVISALDFPSLRKIIQNPPLKTSIEHSLKPTNVLEKFLARIMLI